MIRDQVISALVEAIERINKRLDAKFSVDPALVRKIAAEWLSANVDSLAIKGADGKDGGKGADGKDGDSAPPPSFAEIQAAAEIWLEANRDSLRGEPGRMGLRGPIGIGVRGKDGKDGKDGTNGKDGNDAPAPNADQIYSAAKTWLTANKDLLKGEPGKDGIGIKEISQKGDNLIVELDDGREFKFKTPKGAGGLVYGVGGGGGIASIQAGAGIAVDATDPKNPIVSASGGGSGNQEVFIDEQPVIAFPAISFTQLVGYPGLYRQSVNVP